MLPDRSALTELATATLQTRQAVLVAQALARGSRPDPGPTLIPVNRRHRKNPLITSQGVLSSLGQFFLNLFSLLAIRALLARTWSNTRRSAGFPRWSFVRTGALSTNLCLTLPPPLPPNPLVHRLGMLLLVLNYGGSCGDPRGDDYFHCHNQQPVS